MCAQAESKGSGTSQLLFSSLCNCPLWCVIHQYIHSELQRYKAPPLICFLFPFFSKCENLSFIPGWNRIRQLTVWPAPAPPSLLPRHYLDVWQICTRHTVLTYISVIYINPLGQWEEMTYANAAALSQEDGVGLGRRFVCPLLDRGKRKDTLNQSLCIPAYTSRTIPQRLIVSRRTDSGQVDRVGGGDKERRDRRSWVTEGLPSSISNASPTKMSAHPPTSLSPLTGLTLLLFCCCCFFLILWDTRTSSSPSRPSAEESHLWSARPLFLRLSSAWALTTSSHVSWDRAHGWKEGLPSTGSGC